MAKKVIWAVDAFESSTEAHRRVADLLHALAKREAIDLEAVFVLSPSQLNVPMEISGPWVSQYRPAAEAALDYVLKSQRLTGVARSRVLVQNYSSSNHAVKALVGYAEKNKIELIVAHSHGRTGMERVLMGSFAESLLQQSKVPVLIVGAAARGELKALPLFSSILFPTEFGPNSRRIFRQAVQFAAEVRASVVLFHSVPDPLDPVIQSGAYLLGGTWVPVSMYFSREGDRARRRAEVWARWARGQGVGVEVVIHSQAGSIAEAVLETAAKRQVSMIALEAQTGPIASILVGSVTRQILRTSPIPVLIFRQDMRATKNRTLSHIAA